MRPVTPGTGVVTGLTGHFRGRPGDRRGVTTTTFRLRTGIGYAGVSSRYRLSDNGSSARAFAGAKPGSADRPGSVDRARPVLRRVGVPGVCQAAARFGRGAV